jgi:hypothetical protein
MDIGAEDAGLSVAGPARRMPRKSGCFTRWIRARGLTRGLTAPSPMSAWADPRGAAARLGLG